MGLAASDKMFKSPSYKLLSFFHRSRDGWKAKARHRNVRIKRLKNEVAAVRESRRKWKEKAEAYESRVAELEKELQGQKNSPR
jgi:predicted nuclease with TOPRIM domain